MSTKQLQWLKYQYIDSIVNRDLGEILVALLQYGDADLTTRFLDGITKLHFTRADNSVLYQAIGQFMNIDPQQFQCRLLYRALTNLKRISGYAPCLPAILKNYAGRGDTPAQILSILPDTLKNLKVSVTQLPFLLKLPRKLVKLNIGRNNEDGRVFVSLERFNLLIKSLPATLRVLQLKWLYSTEDAPVYISAENIKALPRGLRDLTLSPCEWKASEDPTIIDKLLALPPTLKSLSMPERNMLNSVELRLLPTGLTSIVITMDPETSSVLIRLSTTLPNCVSWISG